MMTVRQFVVTGMHCEACVALVTEDVGAVEGVETVEVDLGAGTATVRFDSVRVTDDMIVDAIRSAGYDARPS
jgi:copper chaperone